MDDTTAILDTHGLTGPDLQARKAALQELGLTPEADEDAIRDAFRARLKQSHPDVAGGSDTRVRRIILARDLLMSDSRKASTNAQWLRELAYSDIDADGAHLLNITLAQAIYGGEAVQDVHALEITAAHEELNSLTDMKTLRITLPAGLREGDKLRLTTEGALRPEQLFRIHIVLENGARVSGDDIYITSKVEARFMCNGGLTVIDTPHGPREVAVAREQEQTLVLRGLGLPATDKRPCGDLHVHLEAGAPSQRAWSDAREEFRMKWAC